MGNSVHVTVESGYARSALDADWVITLSRGPEEPEGVVKQQFMGSMGIGGFRLLPVALAATVRNLARMGGIPAERALLDLASAALIEIGDPAQVSPSMDPASARAEIRRMAEELGIDAGL